MYYICDGFSQPYKIGNDLVGLENETAFLFNDFAFIRNDFG